MRKYRLIFAFLLLALIFCGCGKIAAETLPSEPATIPATETPTEAPTAAPTEAPTEVPTAEPTEAEAETEAAATELPYLQKVSFADQAIFGGPSYDGPCVGTVKVAGTYTIVEEARDTEGNLWGKLKSGAGWIDLTEVRLRLESPEPLSAAYTDDLLLQSGNFHRYVGCANEYAVSIALRAHETLTDVRLYSMIFNETMELHEELFTLPVLEPNMPLVAELDFPGDMSTFAILFTDSIGNEHFLTLYISGRNGTPVLAPYAP